APRARVPVVQSGMFPDSSLGSVIMLRLQRSSRMNLKQDVSRMYLKGEIVIRKLSVSLLMLVAIVSAMNIVCQAQSQTLLTRHVRDAVRNGEAKPLNRLPATQSMRFDVVLALRHQPELKNFLQELYDPSSSSYKQFVTPQEFTARF